MTQFKVLSLTHQQAPLEIRERMHLDTPKATRLLQQLQPVLGLEEALVLSTCNRTEVYYLAEEDLGTELVKLIAIENGLDHAADYLPYFERITEPHLAVRHLFEVSMGLQSQVVGDLQISNQVKQAYALAAEHKLAGPFLHRLLHTIFHANKRVQQETPYRDGAASVSYAAAELVRDLAGTHAAPSVLIIGTGEMGRDVARHLAQDGFDRLAIMNRTLASAQALAAEVGGEALPLSELDAALKEFLVVVSAVNVDEPIISRAQVGELAAFQQKLLVDLSVPRTISPDVEEVAGVICYTIDEIQAKTNETLRQRLEAVPQVQAIIDTEMHGFEDWSKELSISPTIQRLKEALEQIRREEVARHLKHAGEAEAELVDKVTKSMMNKIIKLPVLQLKAACKRGEQETLIDLLNDLFDLERTRVK